MNMRTQQIMQEFYTLHPDLAFLEAELSKALRLLLDTFRSGGKLLICGNGGSSADSEHIVGELMKGFLLKRPLSSDKKDLFTNLFGEDGKQIAEVLQEALPAISLSTHTALSTAFSNDVDPSLAFAQQVLGYANPGDILLGISTSGNSKNVCAAAMCAHVCGAKVLALTGQSGGKLASLADCALTAPETRTFRIQEYHLAMYHYLCAAVESECFTQ